MLNLTGFRNLSGLKREMIFLNFSNEFILFKEKRMYPNIHYDETNDLAYIKFSEQKIVNSIESEDELLVFDVGSEGELLGIEVMSVTRLLHQSHIPPLEQRMSPEMIPAFIIPQIYQYSRKKSGENSID
jgi:uncharacterized protein YuzE